MNNGKLEIAVRVYKDIIEKYCERKSQQEIVDMLNISIGMVRKVTNNSDFRHTVKRQGPPIRFIEDFDEIEKLGKYEKCLIQ